MPRSGKNTAPDTFHSQYPNFFHRPKAIHAKYINKQYKFIDESC